MEKILKNELVNERTNEQTNERSSERIEQKFMNETSSKTREIEENPFFRHNNQLFRQFLQNIGNCYLLYFMGKKNKKYREKVRWKSAKTGISGIFPAFSAGKKIYSKIGLGHVLSIANTHLHGKNQKNLMMKSRENANKPVFLAFSARNICFSKIGLRHILGIAILHQCAKFHEKI